MLPRQRIVVFPYRHMTKEAMIHTQINKTFLLYPAKHPTHGNTNFCTIYCGLSKASEKSNYDSAIPFYIKSDNLVCHRSMPFKLHKHIPRCSVTKRTLMSYLYIKKAQTTKYVFEHISFHFRTARSP